VDDVAPPKRGLSRAAQHALLQDLASVLWAELPDGRPDEVVGDVGREARRKPKSMKKRSARVGSESRVPLVPEGPYWLHSCQSLCRREASFTGAGRHLDLKEGRTLPPGS
jgi:hypothetical protein